MRTMSRGLNLAMWCTNLFASTLSLPKGGFRPMMRCSPEGSFPADRAAGADLPVASSADRVDGAVKHRLYMTMTVHVVMCELHRRRACRLDPKLPRRTIMKLHGGGLGMAHGWA